MVTCVKSREAINADQDRARAQRAQEKVKDVGGMQGDGSKVLKQTFRKNRTFNDKTLLLRHSRVSE